MRMGERPRACRSHSRDRQALMRGSWVGGRCPAQALPRSSPAGSSEPCLAVPRSSPAGSSLPCLAVPRSSPAGSSLPCLAVAPDAEFAGAELEYAIVAPASAAMSVARASRVRTRARVHWNVVCIVISLDGSIELRDSPAGTSSKIAPVGSYSQGDLRRMTAPPRDQRRRAHTIRPGAAAWWTHIARCDRPKSCRAGPVGRLHDVGSTGRTGVLASAGFGWPPVADGADDLLGGVFLDVVAGALEEDGPVIGEDLPPASSFAFAEGDVLCRPHDQRGAVAQRRQPFFDGGEQRPAGEDLARE